LGTIDHDSTNRQTPDRQRADGECANGDRTTAVAIIATARTVSRFELPSSVMRLAFAYPPDLQIA
jgi:hypothetical protein